MLQVQVYFQGTPFQGNRVVGHPGLRLFNGPELVGAHGLFHFRDFRGLVIDHRGRLALGGTPELPYCLFELVVLCTCPVLDRTTENDPRYHCRDVNEHNCRYSHCHRHCSPFMCRSFSLW